ncbi:MAG TPA: serine/threonine-protein kinase [Gemmatimonadales bacterium]|nr:serine/threonine-protein kinase [Gemmatimonadales bacterium]
MAEVSAPLAELLRDRYTIDHELGHGGMAVVYLAHDLEHSRPVALKLLRPGLVASLGPARFLREIRLTAELQHPNILPVLDSGDAGGQLWFTMPYIEGETLRGRLGREIQLSVDEAIRIAREIASALDYAHQRAIVHRDIKPENILLSQGHALVADFGIAKALGEAAGSRLTETGLVIGTAAYMSPEQAAGEAVDARTDLYSLGCLLYESLAGEPPFTGPTGQALIMKRLAGPPRSLRIIRPDVPIAVDLAIQHALAPEPEDRFASAAELAHALTVQSPPEATAPPPPRRVSRPVEGATGVVPPPLSPQEVTPRPPVLRIVIVVLVLAAVLLLLGLWSGIAG